MASVNNTFIYASTHIKLLSYISLCIAEAFIISVEKKYTLLTHAKTYAAEKNLFSLRSARKPKSSIKKPIAGKIYCKYKN